MRLRNERVKSQLGLYPGTATHRLRKAILFRLVQQTGQDICYRCGNTIETCADLSIDHKEWWENVNPELFWDLDNIAFSHLKCNAAAQRRTNRRRVGIVEYRRCSACKEEYPASCFYKHSKNSGGLSYQCIACDRLRKNRSQNKTYDKLVSKLHDRFEAELTSYTSFVDS